MHKKLVGLTLLILYLSSLFLVSTQNVYAVSWLSGWAYRKSHVINPSSGAGTNYQIRIKVHYGAGIDDGENVYLYQHCKADFGDIRFTKSDGYTELDYWIENKINGDEAVFWVEIADDLNTTAQTIYIYYCNPTATTTSDGDSTFIFFDDFLGTSLNSSKWSSWSYGSGTVADGYLKLDSAGWNLILSVSSPCGNTRQYIKFIRKSTGTDFDLIFRAIDSNNFYQTYVTSYHRQYKNVGGTYNQIGSQVSFSPAVDTAYIQQSLTCGSTLKAYINNSYFISATDTTFTSGKIGIKSYREYWIDWIFVGKYVEPEPSHGAWGSEEEFPRVTIGRLGFDYQMRVLFTLTLLFPLVLVFVKGKR